MPPVYGGYFIEDEKLIEAFKSKVSESTPDKIREWLCDYIAKKELGIDAIAVCYPRGTQMEKFPEKESINGTLIKSQTAYKSFKYLKDCPDLVEGPFDKHVKAWLKKQGVTDVSFVTAPDPLFSFDEDAISDTVIVVPLSSSA